MTFNKAKQIIISEVKKLRFKAAQKRRESEKLEKEANELEAKAKEM